mmetsp:Transcript_31325/g.55051  ORF Transcript_31325/g.55051 Transcript_31325/m.55051 type:complete len:439 (+) Transcript_31325:51-1367(+)
MDAKDAKPSFNYGWVVAMAGFFMHLCLGTMYCWGTFTPYITSYLRKYNPALDYNDTIIVFLITPLAQAIGMPIGGMIENKVGPRMTALIGSWMMAFGVFVSCYTTTVFQLTMTYGITYGIGMGIAYMVPIACGYKWMPKRKGIISGIVVTGFGCGGALFNIIGAGICNPDNLAPSPYFGNSVADQVPRMFMTLGCIYVVATTLGALLLADPSPEDLAALKAGEEPAGEAAPIVPKEHPSTDVDLLGVLQNPKGYLLWAMMGASTSSGVLVVGTYKMLGASAGLNDQLLTIVGSLSLVFNGLGRLFYGGLSDNIGYKSTMIIVFFFQACLGALFISSAVNQYVYSACVCAMVMNYGANFPLFPTVTAELFGTKHVASNYGFVFSGFATAGIMLKFALKSSLGFPTVVMATAIASACAGGGIFVLTGAGASAADKLKQDV